MLATQFYACHLKVEDLQTSVQRQFFWDCSVGRNL